MRSNILTFTRQRRESVFDSQINISKEYFDKRWDKVDFQTLIQVKRTRLETKRAKYSEEISYYRSNEKVITQAQAEVLFGAVRTHWSVETNNNIRDVSLKEDSLKSIEKAVSLTTSVIRTLITNMLQITKPSNIIAQFEDFAEDFSEFTEISQFFGLDELGLGGLEG